MAFYCIKVIQKQGDGPRPVLTEKYSDPEPASSIISQPSTQRGIPHIPTSNLAGLGGNLGGRALSTLLALDALGGALGGTGGALGLLSLLLALGGGLLLLGLLDGLLASGLTGLGAHGAALLDHIEGGTNDGTLVLHNTAGTLLGNFLFVHDQSAFHLVTQIRMS